MLALLAWPHAVSADAQTSDAPSSAAVGWLQRFGSSFILRKYSWNVNRILDQSPPEATILATDSSTA